jgi:predicted SAM-dependent methyltransferase
MIKNSLKTLVRNTWWDMAKRKFPSQADGKTLIHIGCGPINSPGYINIDARRFRHVHVVTKKITSLPLFPDEVADLIYMCHILEHFSRGQVVAVLREMHRLLKPGGTLRLSVPDFDRILNIYTTTGRNINAINGPLMGGQDYEYNFHYAVFNERHLSEQLRSCGYRDVRTWDPDNCQYHDFQDWASMQHVVDGQHFPISLNLEATK